MIRYTWGLTSTEKEIMEVFWELGREISFKELLDWVNVKLNKQWKRQTLTTYLSNLQKLGLIGSNNQCKNSFYYAACTKDEYMHRRTREIVEKYYNNSLTQFISAFTGGQKLSKNEADSAIELLNQCYTDEN